MRKVKRISGGAEAVGVEKMLSVDREQPLSGLMQTFSAIWENYDCFISTQIQPHKHSATERKWKCFLIARSYIPETSQRSALYNE